MDFDIFGVFDIPEEKLEELERLMNAMQWEAPEKRDNTPFTRADIPSLYKLLDSKRESVKSVSKITALARIVTVMSKYDEKTTRWIIQKLAELEGPIAVDSKGVSELPAFDANAFTLDGLHGEKKDGE